MEQLAELLFVLGSMDRLELLSKIRLKKCRLGELSAKISATPQETSRHLMRLRDAMLIEKDSTGLFGLTALGEIVLSLLPSMNILALHIDYFMSHEVMS